MSAPITMTDGQIPVQTQEQIEARGSYYGGHYYTGSTGMLASGIVLLILGIASAILGALSFMFGDIYWGLTGVITGGAAIAGGSVLTAMYFNSYSR